MKLQEFRKLIREEISKILNKTLDGHDINIPYKIEGKNIYELSQGELNNLHDKLSNQLDRVKNSTERKEIKQDLSRIDDFYTHLEIQRHSKNKSIKVKYDITAYPRTHHNPNQPKKIVIPSGESIEIIEHPFEKQPNDSLIKYKGQEWVVVRSSLDVSI